MAFRKLAVDFTRVVPSLRTLSGPVVGGDGNPAVGRTVLVLGRNEGGGWSVIAQTVSDASGNYSVTINAGDNDRFIIIGVGSGDEYTAVLGNMTGWA